jgi:predicted nuclease with TOPRIM domain
MSNPDVVKEKKKICRFGINEQKDLLAIYNDNKNEREIRNNLESGKVPSMLLILWKAYFTNNKDKSKVEKANYGTFGENILKFYQTKCLGLNTNNDSDANTNANANTNAPSKRTEGRVTLNKKRKHEDDLNELNKKQQALDEELRKISKDVENLNERYDNLVDDGVIVHDDYDDAEKMFREIEDLRKSCFTYLSDANMNNHYCQLFNKMRVIMDCCFEMPWAAKFKQELQPVVPTMPILAASSSSSSSTSIPKVAITLDNNQLLKNIRNRRHDRLNTLHNKTKEIVDLIDSKNDIKSRNKSIISELVKEPKAKGFDTLLEKTILEQQIEESFNKLINNLKKYRLLEPRKDFVDNKASYFGVLLDPKHATRNLIICNDSSNNEFESSVLKKIENVIEENFSNGQERRTSNRRKPFFSFKNIQNENENENENENKNADSDSDTN